MVKKKVIKALPISHSLWGGEWYCPQHLPSFNIGAFDTACMIDKEELFRTVYLFNQRGISAGL